MALTSKFQVSVFTFLLCLTALGWLWFVLINDLQVEWTVNPQYSYGWAVPLLCVFLMWRRVRMTDDGRRITDGASQKPETIGFPSSALRPLASVFCLLAFLYAPTRLVEEANSGWRLVSWALAIEVVGLTLVFVRLWLPAFQRFNFSAFIFPVCYFLVAVPWPTLLEQPLIQGLTRVDTNATTGLLGWLGIPAIPHGNVIEVATGVVGIDEACSGIRSFQATLMLSLLFGEIYRLSVSRRSVLCLAGFALSFLFNLVRMSLLVWVAARKGMAAIASWHDPAGVTILLACFCCLWGMGVLLKDRSQKAEGRSENAEKLKTKMLNRESGKREAENRNLTVDLRPPTSVLRPLTIALAFWLMLTETGVEAWYRSHEARLPLAAQWTVVWPTNNPAFKELPLSEPTRQILRYDEGRSATWQSANLVWQAVFLRWKPGRTAIHLAQNHTPEVCMTATGYTLKSISPQQWFEVHGLRMPFLAYQVTDAPQPFFIFYCLWDDRARTQGFETMGLTYGNRLAPVLSGLRNPGQRSLEIAVAGSESASEAEAALRAELETLILSKP